MRELETGAGGQMKRRQQTEQSNLPEVGLVTQWGFVPKPEG
jgi:hypothetical protein